MPLASESVTFAGSGLVFNNTYGAGVTEAYRSAIVTAETYLQSHFTDAVTVAVNFDLGPLDANVAAHNVFFAAVLGYNSFVEALRSHASTPDDLLAVNGLPLVDPTGGAGVALPTAMARMLGFAATPSGGSDLSIVLSDSEPWTFGQDAVGALLHELTEGVMGRYGSLGIDRSQWAPLDFFRFTAGGVRDYTGGGDGLTTYFGVDGQHVGLLAYHNELAASGANDGGDLGDWEFTFSDAFGPGGARSPAVVSATDLQVLDVLGWTPSGSAPAPPAADDFANSLTDATHAFGQVAVGGATLGRLDAVGDRDWFKVQLTAGVNYVITETGADGGGGTLADPFMRVHDASGALLGQSDDIVLAEILDSRLVLHATTSGTYYVEAGSFLDDYTGSYTIRVAAGAPAATAGNDLLVGDAGGATLAGGTGADTIMGADAQNYLRGDEGDDVINGGAAFDDINGNMGNDTAHGGLGDDWVVGGKDDDVLFGDDGNDIVYGNLGNDTCIGGWNNDLIRGGQGDDSLSGGQGADWLSGDRGSDTVSGGSGADIFHTFNGAGLDVVTDFSIADGDRVQLDAGTTFTLRQVGADTVIDLGGGEQMILKNVVLAALPAGWIFGA